MQVTEISAQGLRREFKIVLPASDLASRLENELVELRGKVRINGFRPGKVPLAHLRRLYGRSVMGDVVQNALNEANRKIVEDNKLRLALEPKIDLASEQADLEKAMEATGDLAFTVAVETIPEFETGSFADVALERQVAPVADEDIERTLNNLANQNRVFSPRGEDGAAQDGDKVTIDFTGTINGEAFEGGTGSDIDVVIGSNSFIPGFEEQLVGAKAGEERTIAVSFPENYLAAHLAGRAAEFKVTVKAVAAPDALTLDDEFSKQFGFDSIDAMKAMIRERLQGELDRASRDRLKRNLLDALDKRFDFQLPEGLVAQEFDNIWRQVTEEQRRTNRSFADEGTTEEEARAEYRRIAERRVRLGLVLAEVGEKAGVRVDDQEISRALVERARQFPGQEQQVWDFYRKNPQALNEIRAPLFEDKVVDLIVSQAQVTERAVSREELLKPIEDELHGAATASAAAGTGGAEPAASAEAPAEA